MSWLFRYSQDQNGVGDVVKTPQGMMPQLFNGEAVNKIIQERVVSPLNEIANETAASFLDNLQQDTTRQLAALLAWNGKLDDLYGVVAKYDPNVVVDGTEISRNALEGWFARFEAAGGNRVPFDTLRTEVENNANR